MTTYNKPLVPFGWLRALLYILACLLFAFIIMMVSGGVSGAANNRAASESNASIGDFLLMYAIVGFGLIGLAVLARKFADRQSIVSMGFEWKGYQSQAAAGFFIAILILSFGSIVLVLLKFLFFTGVELNVSNLLLSLVLFILVAFTEEIVFRGYILNNLMQSMPKWVALTVSSVVFALFHFTNPGGAHWLPMLNIFVAGYLLGINYIYTKNLWFAIFLHLGWNFFQGPILGYDVSGFAATGLFQQTIKGPELLTGGDFGFEGSLICLILNTVTCFLLARYYMGKPAKLTPVEN